jgi:hypothetical protein
LVPVFAADLRPDEGERGHVRTGLWRRHWGVEVAANRDESDKSWPDAGIGTERGREDGKNRSNQSNPEFLIRHSQRREAEEEHHEVSTHHGGLTNAFQSREGEASRSMADPSNSSPRKPISRTRIVKPEFMRRGERRRRLT